MSFRLTIVDDAALERSKSGTIWGRVYFENGDQFFPEQGWTDMAVPFLSAWLDALIRMATRATREEVVWFMDGPFKVVLSLKDHGTVAASLMHNEIADQSANATLEDLLQNAVSLGQQILTICEQRGWQDRDTLALANGTKRTVDILPRLKR
jgi:hypothetical protein